MGKTAIGIDIGGTNLRAARISASGEILERLAARSARDPEIVLGDIVDLVRRLDAEDVAAIGVGVPGRVDWFRQVVLSGGYVDLAGIPLAERIEAACGKPVVIDNDCSMALVAELGVGAAHGRRNVAMFTIGTGIGGAIAEDGRLLRGRGTAGQLGHITVDVAGAPCLCGRRGCVETTSSGSALARHIAEAGLSPDLLIDNLFDSPVGPTSREARVLKAWAGPLRAAIDSVVATLDIELVLLGGGLGAAAHRALGAIPAAAPWYQCTVEPATLGDDAGVIGAGLAALADHRPAPSRPPSRRAGTVAKRAVLVNGIPASGKSRVARALSDRTGWPILTLDTVKNPFLVELGGADRAFNRSLGRASYEAIWSLVRDAPSGTTVIVDAWFGFQPRDLLESHLAMAGVGETFEVWCHAPGAVLAERYAARLGERPDGHPGAAYIPELIDLSKRAAPIGRGPLFDVDSTRHVDLDAIIAWLKPQMPLQDRLEA